MVRFVGGIMFVDGGLGRFDSFNDFNKLIIFANKIQ